MKQFFKMFFASFLAMFVAGVVLLLIFVGIIFSVTKSFTSDNNMPAETGSNAVLVIDLEKQIHEQGEMNSIASFTGDNALTPGLYTTTKAIRHAANDNNVKGILIKGMFSGNGMATSQQIRDAIIDFRKSNKFVYAYGEVISQSAYYVASAAEKVFLNPAGFPELKGLYTTLAFFKGTLDKLEIEPEIFYAGKFKSATEPFRAKEISEPNRKQIEAFQEDFWAEYLKAFAQHAHTDEATIDQLTKSGAVQFASDALRYHLVDDLFYWDQVEDLLRKKTGKSATAKVNYVEMANYAATMKAESSTGDNRIAVLFAEGNIVDGEANDAYQIASKDINKTIQKLRNNDKIKAVVLRINSPGGSALASDVILRELQLLKNKKPLIVSMGDLAASGGYYIACAADSIFALPTTITGSIGVFTMLFNSKQFLNNKLGITTDVVKNAPYADFPSLSKPLTPDEAAKMQAIVDTIYHTFKMRVVNGRHLAEADVDSIAQGRVWSGKDALDIYLVDALGGLDRAILSASRIAKLKTYDVVTYPEPVDKFEMMMQRLGNVNAFGSAYAMALKQELGEDYAYYKMVQELKTMNGKAQMTMPFKMNIR